MRFRHHVFVCENRRPPGHPKGSCAEAGGPEVREALKAELRRRGLDGQVRANGAGCLDACEHGVTVVVYPEGVWYGHVTLADVDEIFTRHVLQGEIVERHLVGGEPVERLVIRFEPPAR